MINKNYKIIHNKYLRFFKFFFFLRHVFAIFLIAILSFLLIPKFFNYEKKERIIMEYLANHYDLELINYSSIEFKVLPFPNLSIKDSNLKFKKHPIFFNTKNLNIFLHLKNLYDYEKFEAKKILLNDSEINLDIERTNNIFNYFGTLKHNLDIQNLDLNFKKKENSILELKKIYFSNYGYKKSKIKGEIFNKRFKAYLSKNNKDLKFKILNTGIKADFNFDKTNRANLISGSSKISILNNYLKFKFVLQDNQIEIIKSSLKNKDLSISFDSSIVFDPFFETSSNININKINERLINNLRLENILEKQEILKRLNSSSKINYTKKKIYNTLIQSHSSELNFAYGRLTFVNKTYISGGDIDCKGDTLLIEEYPRLKFSCLFNLKNKKKLLKKFSIPNNIDSSPLYLNVEGSLNLLKKKINFDKIDIGKNKANLEDMKYFKETFESILFDDDFFSMFRKKKIKEFLLEVI